MLNVICVNHTSFVYHSICQAQSDKAVAESLASERLGAISRAEKDAQLWRGFVSNYWNSNEDDASQQLGPDNVSQQPKRRKRKRSSE